MSAPTWFTDAINETVDELMVQVHVLNETTSIHCLRWGSSNTKRPLVFVHGGGAHANWYRFIAPFFMKEFDVCAITNSGNGKSSSRSIYGLDIWALEIFQVCQTLGFLEPDRPKPFIVSHSMGVFVTIYLMRMVPGVSKQFQGCVLVDGAIRSPELAQSMHEEILELRKNDPNSKPRDGWKINPVDVRPIDRFKLKPPQECANDYILTFLAESNVKRVSPDGSWIWEGEPNRDAKFDWYGSKVFNHLDVQEICKDLNVAFVYGEESVLCDEFIVSHVRQTLASSLAIVGVAGAQHHVWLDEPLAFVGTLRGIFAGWQHQVEALDKPRNVGNLQSRL